MIHSGDFRKFHSHTRHQGCDSHPSCKFMQCTSGIIWGWSTDPAKPISFRLQSTLSGLNQPAHFSGLPPASVHQLSQWANIHVLHGNGCGERSHVVPPSFWNEEHVAWSQNGLHKVSIRKGRVNLAKKRMKNDAALGFVTLLELFDFHPTLRRRR